MVAAKTVDFFLQIATAAKIFTEQETGTPPDFVVFPPKVVRFYKKRSGFEPLSDYIDKVQPYDGEVGRYDTGIRKIRIVQTKEWRG